MEIGKVTGVSRYRIANTSAIIMVVFLGAVSVSGALDGHGVTITGSVLFTTILTVLLLFAYNTINDYSKLAFFVPFVLFVLNSAVLASNEWHAYFYLLACLFILGISCLYTDFPQTLVYFLLQTVSIVVLYLLGFPVAGRILEAIGPFGVLFVFIFISSCLFMLIVTRIATAGLNKAKNDANSFRTYLATTKDYLAMLDYSNRILYVSKPLSDLARIGDPELTKGRPFVDLFPSRELKILAHRMLGRRELYEENWEFTLYKQKRYFKAVSSGILEGAASREGTLITMLDMTYLAERDEIAAMRDSLKIGLFFMDREFVILDNYSRFLEEVLSESDLKGKRFTDILSASFAAHEMGAVKDYMQMIFDRTFDVETLNEINPLHELNYIDSSGFKKIFNCTFLTVDLAEGETVVLVTIYDVTAQTELKERLQREERKRQEEMSSLFELIQVEPATFKAFREDVEAEFDRIDKTLSDSGLSSKEVLVEIYQSIHAIKSNAVTLGLNNFGTKAHEVESEIKKLRDAEGEALFDDMLHLTIEIERLALEKESFKLILEKIDAFKLDGENRKSNENVFLESLTQAASKAATDMEKKVRFIAAEIDSEAIEKGPRRVMKEVLMQLIRNSVVHGVEPPDERVSKGKSETGTIRLSIKHSDNSIHVKLSDDGRGLDFGKIREKAVSMNLLNGEEAENKNQLLKTIFSPGFSTAENEEGMHAGRGIGLSLVQDRVRDVRGTIKLQTELDKGTVFNIFFPMETAEDGEIMDKAS